MGFLDSMKQAAAAAKEGLDQAKDAVGSAKQGWSDMVADQRAADEAARLAQASARIIDPTSQEELDRINAGDGPGRGVVTGNSNTLEDGESVFRAKVTLYVRMRLSEGRLGPEKPLGMWTSSTVIRALVPGTEIPVAFDRVSEEPTELDQKLIAAEMKSRKRSGGRGF